MLTIVARRRDLVRVRAAAKVNLHLAVLGRRPDGFHEVETLLVPIDLYDEIEALPRAAGVSVACDAPSVPSDASNLAHRAASALLARRGVVTGVSLAIRKGIPVGAGLGGGSADAAAALAATDLLLGLGATSAEMEEIARSIGADCPFFLADGPRLARGRGERLEPIAPFPPLDLVCAYPGFPLATASVYVAWSPFPHRARPPLEDLLAALGAGGAARIAPLLSNDLEPVACALEPRVGRLLGRLRAMPLAGAVLTGSGSACIGLAPDRAAAEAAAESLRREGTWAVAARTFPKRGDMT